MSAQNAENSRQPTGIVDILESVLNPAEQDFGCESFHNHYTYNTRTIFLKAKRIIRIFYLRSITWRPNYTSRRLPARVVF